MTRTSTPAGVLRTVRAPRVRGAGFAAAGTVACAAALPEAVGATDRGARRDRVRSLLRSPGSTAGVRGTGCHFRRCPAEPDRAGGGELHQRNLTDTPDARPERPARGRSPSTSAPHLAGRFRTPRRLVQRSRRPRHGDDRHPLRPQRRRSTRRFPKSMPGLMEPNPHTISRTLMRRDRHSPRPPPSTCWRPPGSSSRRTTGSRTTASPKAASSRSSTCPTATPGTRTRCESRAAAPTTRAPERRRAPAADVHQPGLALVGLPRASTASPQEQRDRVRTFAATASSW